MNSKCQHISQFITCAQDDAKLFIFEIYSEWLTGLQKAKNKIEARFMRVCLWHFCWKFWNKSNFWELYGNLSSSVVVGNRSIHTMPKLSKEGLESQCWSKVVRRSWGVRGGWGGWGLSLPIRLVFIEGRQMRWAMQAVTETRVMTGAVCSGQTLWLF